ncbi:MAG: alpha/beta fold hydrolase, partial [Myxococcota bacterium]
MGGLVCRSFVLSHQSAGGEPLVRLLITIGTPYGGNAAARKGVEKAPAVVRSWIDLDPQSAFLRGLFYTDDGQRRRLPSKSPFHLLFGYRRRAGRPGQSSDGTIPLESSLRLEAQEEAASVRGFDAGHVGLLRDPALVGDVTSLIAAAAAR